MFSIQNLPLVIIVALVIVGWVSFLSVLAF